MAQSGLGAGMEGKTTGVSHEVARSAAFRRRLRWTLFLIILALAFGYWGYFLEGRTVFLQSISAEMVSRGFDFGPIYLEKGKTYALLTKARVPQTGPTWEMSLTTLDSTKRVIQTETEILLTDRVKLRPGDIYRKRQSFTVKEKDSGYFYFHFYQKEGNYSILESLSAPVLEFKVKSKWLTDRVVIGGALLLLLLGLAMVVTLFK